MVQKSTKKVQFQIHTVLEVAVSPTPPFEELCLIMEDMGRYQKFEGWYNNTSCGYHIEVEKVDVGPLEGKRAGEMITHTLGGRLFWVKN